MTLVSYKDVWCVRCCLIGPDGMMGNNFFVRPPLPPDCAAGLLAKFGRVIPAFVEFFRHFAGLRENYPRDSGCFVYDQFTLFSENTWSQNAKGLAKKWMNALCFYGALNGDTLLLNQQGELSWFYHEESRVRLYAKTFEEFIEKYTEFNEKYSQVFDGYSSVKPDEWGRRN